MPKLEIIYGEELGSIKVPGRLKVLLDGYCIRQGRTRSDVIRSALSAWLHVDMETVLEHDRLGRQEENNDRGQDTIK